MKRSSLALRLAFLVGVLGLLQAVAVLTFSYVILEKELDAQKRTILLDKAQQARLVIDDLQDSAAVKANAFKIFDLVSGHTELHLAVAASDSGEVYVAFSQEARQSLQRLKNDVWQTDAFLTWKSPGKESNMLSLATAGRTRNAQPYEVVVTADRTDDARLLRKLPITAATAAPFALALVVLGALVIVSLGLKPLQQLQQAVGRISAKTLADRLVTQALPSELQSLGTAFNAMLNRLDNSVTRLSEFSGDLAHEMRTPLATLLGRTQVALSQPRSNGQLIDVLAANVEELQRLTRLVADMLFLAQADYATNVLALEKFALDQEASRVVEFLDLVAQERDVSITVRGSALITADRGLVQRAIINLLTNAIRHCTPSTDVQLVIRSNGSGVDLDVVNRGSMIAPEHMDRIFDRFYRVDGSRERDLGGAGLGLAIVKAIMALHGGTVRARGVAPDEVIFSLHFPT